MASAFKTQHFADARQNLQNNCDKLQKCVRETSTFVKENETFGTDEARIREDLSSFDSRIHNIIEAISRKTMKVAVFGRTSNGKSTVINAILGKEILPSGCGHTTNCTLQFEGVNTTEPYLIRANSDVHENISNISIADALSADSVEDCATLVRICYPKDSCELLKDHVVILDTPGTDKTDDLDMAIEKHSLDADVFIYVVNSFATLSSSEKNFLRMLSKKISVLNIFILMNHWDTVISKYKAKGKLQQLEQLREKHVEDSLTFLVDELKAAKTPQEAKRRVFFVSAEKVLNARDCNLSKQTDNDSNEPEFLDLHKSFRDFEKECGKTVSKEAVRTKFCHHIESGKEICSSLFKIISAIQEGPCSEETPNSDEKFHKQKMVQTKKEYESINSNLTNWIFNSTEEAKQKFEKDFSNAIDAIKNFVKTYGGIPRDEKKAAQWLADLCSEFKKEVDSKLLDLFPSTWKLYEEKFHREITDMIKSNQTMLPILQHYEKKSVENAPLLKEKFTKLNSELIADIYSKLSTSDRDTDEPTGCKTARDLFLGMSGVPRGISAVAANNSRSYVIASNIATSLTMIASAIVEVVADAQKKAHYRDMEKEVKNEYSSNILSSIRSIAEEKRQLYFEQLKLYMEGNLKFFCKSMEVRIKAQELQNIAQELNEEYNQLYQKYICE